MISLVKSPVKSNTLWRHIAFAPKRCKHKDTHWSIIARKKFPVDRALEHYDDFYKTVFGTNWPSIRIALLSQHKYCAVVNNYSDTEKIISDLENQGAINIKQFFEVELERIQDTVQTDENVDLKKIYKLNKKMELLMLSKKQEELESLYPPNDGIAGGTALQSNESEAREQVSIEELKRRSVESLKTSLEQAELDEHRMIDPSSGVSAAGLYEFIPATKLKGMEDFVPESQHYSYYKGESDFPVTVTTETDLHLPEHLHIYTFERGNLSPFPPPRRGSTGVFSYYLMDGGSVLPVLALGLQPNDHVLDMCSAPGGKALMMLQTLYPERVVCNDVQESRTTRIRSVLEQYFYNLKERRKEIVVTQRDGRRIDEKDVFNKILVDVPCTTDRLALRENDNNIFKPSRTKERLKLPETQSELLFNALTLVSKGGTVVYSTCSLSPIQNDGVVHMALRKVWEETKIQLEVRDMTVALQQAQSVFKLGGRDIGLKYGHLVIPFLPNNFGPQYFCKIVRTE